MDKEIEVKCPICRKTGKVSVPESIFLPNKLGLIKVDIPAGAICHDTFLMFIDKNGVPKGFERIDMRLSPEIEGSNIEIGTDKKILTLNDLIQIFDSNRFVHLLHASLFNYTCYVIRDENTQDIQDDLNYFLNNLILSEYQNLNRINFIDETEYSTIKNEVESALFIDSKDVKLVPWKEKLKFEEKILSKALEMITPEDQLFILKQEIEALMDEVENSCHILADIDSIKDSELITNLSRELRIPKIDNDRLISLMIFIRQQIDPGLEAKIQTKLRKKI